MSLLDDLVVFYTEKISDRIGTGGAVVMEAIVRYVAAAIAVIATHADSHVDGTDDIRDATAELKGLATAAQITELESLGTTVDCIETDVLNIRGRVDALAVLEETGGTITSELGTGITVYRNNTPAGVFNPRCVKIATSNQTATETITVREYYRLESGGALLLHDSVTYAGLIAMEVITVSLDPNRFGVEVTLTLDAGTPRDYPWEALYEV